VDEAGRIPFTSGRLNFVRVVVLKPFVGGIFTYARPDPLDSRCGDLVLVPFGSLGQWGVVVEASVDAPEDLPVSRIKAVDALLARNFLFPPLVGFGLAVSRNQFTLPGDIFLRFLPPQPDTALGVRYQRCAEPPAKQADLWQVLPDKPVTLSTLVRRLRARKVRKSLSSLIGSRILRIVSLDPQEPAEEVGWHTGEGFSLSWAAQIPPVILEMWERAQVLIEFPTTAQVEAFLSRAPAVPIYRHDSGESAKNQISAWRAARSGTPGLHLAVHNGPFLHFPNLKAVVVVDEANPAYISRDRVPVDIREACLLRARFQNIPFISVSRVPRLYLYLNAQRPDAEPGQMAASPGVPRAVVFPFKGSRRRSPHTTRALYERLQQHWQDGAKVVFLVAARGEGYLACNQCGAVLTCSHCGRTLRWSEDHTRLVCGSCRAHPISRPEKCPECGEGSLRTRGITAARFQRELEHLAPEIPTLTLPGMRKGGWSALERWVRAFFAREGPANLVATPDILLYEIPESSVRVVVRGDSFWASGEERPPEWGVGAVASFFDGGASSYLQVDGSAFSAVKSFTSGDLSEFFEDERLTRELLGTPPFCASLEVRIPAFGLAQAERLFRRWRAIMGIPFSDRVDISGPAPGARTRNGVEYVWWLRTRSPEEMEGLYSSEAVASALRHLPVRWRVTYR
jgi:primosomal protein N'